MYVDTAHSPPWTCLQAVTDKRDITQTSLQVHICRCLTSHISVRHHRGLVLCENVWAEITGISGDHSLVVG